MREQVRTVYHQFCAEGEAGQQPGAVHQALMARLDALIADTAGVDRQSDGRRG